MAMSQANYITLTGFVTREPDLNVTRNNISYAKIRVGSASRYPDRTTGEWVDGDVSYFDVTCWRRLAVNVKACLHKGDMITVRGKFRTSSWTVEGEDRPRTKMEIVADSVGHDLAYGWTVFNRGPVTPGRVTEELEKGEAARADDGDPDEGYASDYAELRDQPADDGGHDSVLAGTAVPAATAVPAGTSTSGDDVPRAADERQLEDVPF
jgi:single-strand DNA-binding protein